MGQHKPTVTYTAVKPRNHREYNAPIVILYKGSVSGKATIHSTKNISRFATYPTVDIWRGSAFGRKIFYGGPLFGFGRAVGENGHGRIFDPRLMPPGIHRYCRS